MAYQGGKWTTPEGILPGARINVIAKERATSILSPRGILAVPMELNWGVEDEALSFVGKDYTKDSLYKFGYESGSKELRDIGEMFKGATEIIIARLNTGGAKASCELGEAKWSGIRGNDIAVSVEADPDAGIILNPLAEPKVTFEVEGDTVRAKFKKVPEGYEISARLYLDGTEIPTSVCPEIVGEDEISRQFTVLNEPGTYELKAALSRGNANYVISVGEFTMAIDPATERTVRLTKGQEKPGTEVKPTVVEKYGFVKTAEELNEVIAPGESAYIDHKSDIFYFEFPKPLENGNHYVALFEVDDKTYADVFGDYRYYYIGLGKGGEDNGNPHNSDASFVKDAGSWKAFNNKSDASIDVTGKTVKLTLARYDEEVTLATLAKEPAEKIIDAVTINCAASVKNGAVTKGTAASAAYTFSDNRATIKFSDVPEGYTPSVRLKMTNVGAVVAMTPGRIENKELSDGKTQLIDFYPDAAATNYTVEAALIKDGKWTVISSCQFTMAVEGEDKPETVSLSYSSATPVVFDKQVPKRYIVKTFLDGAEVNKQKVKGMYQIRDNDFVVWNKERELELTAGMPLAGGTNGAVNAGSWADALNKLEPQTFHCLAWPTTDETLQQLAIEFTRKMRDEMGVKFQTVMPKTIEPANYEGVIQVENSVNDLDVKDQEAALVYWVGGQEAGCKVQNSVANTLYDGVYDINVDYSQRDLEAMVESGYFGFHLARGIDRKQYVKVLLDINTLTEPAKDQNEYFKNNQTIRVCDQCCNDIAAIFNNNYFGKVPNNQPGREQLKNDIILHHTELENIQAIENFDPSVVSVEDYEFDKVTVIANDAITPVNAMEKLFMTIVII